MKKIIPWLNDSVYTAPLSPACSMCAQGSKMVILATGRCPANCFYCPLSLKKKGNDRIFADEWELDNKNDTKKLVQEAEYIDATGAGITGGDPLIVWKRVKKYILFLKEMFGSTFHIHLYTSALKNGDKILDLISAGLDEIRFHPLPSFWHQMNNNPITTWIQKAKATGIDVALEIPVLPDKEEAIFSLLRWAEEHELQWVNLNELEYSESNFEYLDNMKYCIKNDISAAVKGSQETARHIISRVYTENLTLGVHYCSVSFKDGIQLKNRIKRRAFNIAKEYEVITEEGTLLKGAIYMSETPLIHLYSVLKNEYNVSENLLFIDTEKNRIEIGLWILEKIAQQLSTNGYMCYLVEEYPTTDRLEVERIPLPL
jgi:hypothetical protein